MKIYPEGIRAYLAANAASVRTPATRRSYSQRLAELHRFCNGKDVRRYTEADLVAYCQAGDNPAPKTVALRRTVCKQFFRWAFRAGHCPTDPGLYLEDAVKVKAKVLRPANWLTEGQVRSILAGCDDTPLGRRDRVALTLGFSTGLRASEICNLRWDHIDFSTGLLAVFGKGEKPGFCGITESLETVLLDWRTTCQAGPVVPRLRVSWGEKNLCLGTPLGPRGLADLVAKRGAAAGVESLAPHDMRRTFAGILQSQGVPIEEISGYLRHDSIATTQAYLQRNPTQAARKLRGRDLGF